MSSSRARGIYRYTRSTSFSFFDFDLSIAFFIYLCAIPYYPLFLGDKPSYRSPRDTHLTTGPTFQGNKLYPAALNLFQEDCIHSLGKAHPSHTYIHKAWRRITFRPFTTTLAATTLQGFRSPRDKAFTCHASLSEPSRLLSGRDSRVDLSTHTLPLETLALETSRFTWTLITQSFQIDLSTPSITEPLEDETSSSPYYPRSTLIADL